MQKYLNDFRYKMNKIKSQKTKDKYMKDKIVNKVVFEIAIKDFDLKSDGYIAYIEQLKEIKMLYIKEFGKEFYDKMIKKIWESNNKHFNDCFKNQLNKNKDKLKYLSNYKSNETYLYQTTSNSINANIKLNMDYDKEITNKDLIKELKKELSDTMNINENLIKIESINKGSIVLEVVIYVSVIALTAVAGYAANNAINTRMNMAEQSQDITGDGDANVGMRYQYRYNSTWYNVVIDCEHIRSRANPRVNTVTIKYEDNPFWFNNYEEVKVTSRKFRRYRPNQPINVHFSVGNKLRWVFSF